jgi:hypothetical protein
MDELPNVDQPNPRDKIILSNQEMIEIQRLARASMILRYFLLPALSTIAAGLMAWEEVLHFVKG